MPSAASNTKSSTTKSGIATTRDGERHIPASTRPDGSLRKEIRVRPGYRPPEDVEVYKNRTAEAWKHRADGGVPGAETLEGESFSASTNKNARRREARKKAAAKDGADPDGDSEPGPKAGALDSANVTSQSVETVDPEAEKAKEARKLSKKVRQAKELRAKKDQGDALLPEQFEKVIKINELIRQLDKLGFDAEGEKITT